MKKKIINYKGGEMTSKMLVTIILLIVGFGIILMVYYQFDWTGDVDREVCHESVILRGTLPDILGTGSKEVTPLKCKTRKICVTVEKLFGKGACDTFGEKYVTEEISKDERNQETNIKKLLADELADCWSMMGEGKIQVFEREVASSKKACVICSRIDFDDSVKVDKIEGLSNYLKEKKVPNKNSTYFQFLTNFKGEDYSLSPKEIDVLDMNEKAIIFSEQDGSKFSTFVNALGLGASSAVIGGFAGAKIGFIGGPHGAAIGFIAGAATGAFIIDEGIRDIANVNDYFSSIYIVDYDVDDIEKLECDSIESIS